MRKTIIREIMPGIELEKIADAAIRLKKITLSTIRFEFNGKKIFVTNKSTIDSILSDYYNQVFEEEGK